MKRSKLFPTLILGSICLVVALLLAAVNMLTSPIIEERKIEATSASLRVVMPEGAFSDSEPIPSSAPDTVTGIYKDINGGGHVVTLSTSKGYTGKPILITVAVDNDGKIIKAVVTSSEESKTNDEMDTYHDRFSGVDSGSIDKVDTVAGITYSSTAVKSAIRDALVVLGYAAASEEKEDVGVRGPVTRSDEEIYSLALSLIPGAESLEEVSFDGSDPTLIKAYKADGRRGYVFYVSTGAWGRLESEALFATNNLGTITDINFLSWGVGHGVDYTEQFVESFVGKDKNSLERVELVAEATSTSVNFREAVYRALDVAFGVQIYKIAAAVIIAVALVSAGACVIIARKRRIVNQ